MTRQEQYIAYLARLAREDDFRYIPVEPIDDLLREIQLTGKLSIANSDMCIFAGSTVHNTIRGT